MKLNIFVFNTFMGIVLKFPKEISFFGRYFIHGLLESNVSVMV